MTPWGWPVSPCCPCAVPTRLLVLQGPGAGGRGSHRAQERGRDEPGAGAVLGRHRQRRGRKAQPGTGTAPQKVTPKLRGHPWGHLQGHPGGLCPLEAAPCPRWVVKVAPRGRGGHRAPCAIKRRAPVLCHQGGFGDSGWEGTGGTHTEGSGAEVTGCPQEALAGYLGGTLEPSNRSWGAFTGSRRGLGAGRSPGVPKGDLGGH